MSPFSGLCRTMTFLKGRVAVGMSLPSLVDRIRPIEISKVSLKQAFCTSLHGPYSQPSLAKPARSVNGEVARPGVTGGTTLSATTSTKDLSNIAPFG
jgi:hypothetical protein